jgi:integrase
MARKVKDKELDSRDARRKLKPRGMPYYRTIERGLHLGYRRLKGQAGTWWARHYVGEQQYEVESLGIADDLSDADGEKVLDFWQAQTQARKRMAARAHAAAGRAGPYTVKDAIGAYLAFLESERKSAKEARYRADAFILPKLGAKECSALTAEDIEHWRNAVAKAAPRRRTRPGEAQKFAAQGKDAESIRRRRSTTNRTLTVLKAALNRAWKKGKVASDDAWRRVEPFENADAARKRYLKVEEADRLINAADPDFRPLVQAALATGARYGELAALEVRDFNPDSETLHIPASKSGRERHVVLTAQGVKLFARLAAGRQGDALLLPKGGDSDWRKSNQIRPIAEASRRARIIPPVNFHCLRHTYASHAAMNGVPLLVLAKNLGHSDTRMVEKHYGHLAPSYIADAIRAGAPQFDFQIDDKVRPMITPAPTPLKSVG